MDPRREKIRRIADTLDNRFQTPFGRVGWDGILGLIPGIGDIITSLLSLYVIGQAALMGVSPVVILRMGGNVLLENLVDAVPLFGNIFDFFWKANSRNLALVDRYFQDPHRTRRNSGLLIAFVLLIVVAAIVAMVAGAIYLLIYLWHESFGALR